MPSTFMLVGIHGRDPCSLSVPLLQWSWFEWLQKVPSGLSIWTDLTFFVRLLMA